MRTSVPPLLALVLSTSLPAQFTMPPGYLVKEQTAADGNVPYSAFFGAYPEQRMQVISADWTLKPAVTIKSIAVRRDSEYYYSSGHGQARSWSRVTIQLADSEWLRSSVTFTKNLRSSPTTVFDAPTNWGATNTQPSAGQQWGASNMGFGFSSPYTWRRLADICIDVQFTGGKLSGGAGWTAANYVMLDGFSDSLDNGPFYNHLLTATCANKGYFAATIRTHGSFHSQPDTMGLDVFCSGSAPSTPHIGSVGVRGSRTGIPIGACHNLYLQHTPVIYRFTTSANGTWWQPRIFLAFNPAFAGIEVYSQAAFSHPVNRAFQLTGAMRSIIPAAPKWSGFRQLRISSSIKNATTGTIDSTYVPILRIL